MYRELETQPDQAKAAGSESAVPCDCVCSEPAPTDGDEAPAGNKSAVIIQVHYDING